MIVSDAAALPLQSGAGAAGPIRCPARLASEQRAGAPAGWEAARSAKDGPLEAIAFYDGPPAEQVELAPTAERKEGEWLSSVWTFAGNAKPVQIACRYRGTDVVLTRRVPITVRQCSLRLRRGSVLIEPMALRCR